MDRDEFARRFQEEVRRLRLNPLRLGGLATAGDPSEWQDTILSRMRRLEPGATWPDVFPDEPAAFVARPDDAEWIKEFDSDPERYWREQDEGAALLREMDRVIPAELRALNANAPDVGWGVSFPHGVRHALAVLRQLPDRAGTDAFIAALERTPPEASGGPPEPVT
jgi:hypothetical protein